MVLIALLIALSIERLYHSPDALHWQFYLSRWQHWSASKLSDEKWQSAPAIFLRTIAPALFVGLLIQLLDNLLVTFLVSIAALLLAINLLLMHYPKLNRRRIIGHEHIAPGRKTDPGSGFDWPRYLNQL